MKLHAFALAAWTFAATASGLAATPAPKPVPIPIPPQPKVALHTEFNVEVNKLGQVVLVKSGKDSKDTWFNAQTYGNVLQMWIRHPDGTATVGMYHVAYDYSPRTHAISRHVSLIKAGGNWGDKQGAANEMLGIAKREAAQARLKEQEKRAKNLPDINAIIRKDLLKPKPSPSPSRSPH